MNLFTRLLLIFFSTGLLLFSACDRDKPGPTDRKTLSGVVVDPDDRPLSGIRITAHGKSTLTDDLGLFSLEDVEVPAGRGVVTAADPDYYAGVQGFVPSDDEVQYVRIVLMPLEVTAVLDAATGGEAVLGNGAGVELPAGGIVRENGSAYSGTVEVAVQHLDPTDADFAAMVAGGDLQAIRTDESEASLYSYGILRVEMRDPAGTELQLASGTSATIRVPVPTTMSGTAPATIPLWYLDEETGLWMEEGEATRQGNEYVGTVTHFTDWNCDVPEGTGTVKGRLLDCNNNPLSNLEINVGQGTTITDAEGYFTRRVPAGVNFTIASASNVVTFSPVNVNAVSEGATENLSTIVTSCPVYLDVTITGCSGNPQPPYYISASWSGGTTTFFSQETSFRMPVAPNTTVSIQAWDFSSNVGTATVQTGGPGSVTTADISLCAGALITPARITLNGGPFTNQEFIIVPFQIFNVSTALSTYRVSDNETDLYVLNSQGNSTGLEANGIPGKTTGTFPLDDQGTSLTFFFSGITGNDSLFYTLGDIVSGSLTLDQYGAVGGLVRGSFSAVMNGDIFNYTNQTSTPLTNISISGTFEAVRGPDE
ncbi:MAG: hypothetical protein SF053_08380 [Bacteroidia bacterium]|nr:hypothetical protein [Bacteroidia bacterium]